MRNAFQNLGDKCVFSSEIDEKAQKTYAINFGDMPEGDITKINEHEIPNHDVLVGGFPCQAFSIAGKHGGFGGNTGEWIFGSIFLAAMFNGGFGFGGNRGAGLTQLSVKYAFKNILKRIFKHICNFICYDRVAFF